MLLGTFLVTVTVGLAFGTQEGLLYCPYPSAVSCSDQTHCCPNGYQCDLAARVCEKPGQAEVTPMLTKILTEEAKTLIDARRAVNASVHSPPGARIITCDSDTFCYFGTCCRLTSGKWGCCDYVNAVCCKDGQHCCPSGYYCTSTTCRNGATPQAFTQMLYSVISLSVLLSLYAGL